MRQWWSRHALYLLESDIESVGVLSCRYDLLRVERRRRKRSRAKSRRVVAITKGTTLHCSQASENSSLHTETRLLGTPTYTRQTTKHNEATILSSFLRPTPHPCLLLAPATIAATTSDIIALFPTFSSKRKVPGKKRVSRVVTNFSERAGLKLETVL